MKVQVVGFGHGLSHAEVEVKLPDGNRIRLPLPTNKVLTLKEFKVVLKDGIKRLDEMGKRVQIVKDLMFQEIDLK